MTQYNNNLSVLPFYDSLDKQNHRKTYAYGEVYPLFCPIGRILPFQFMTEHRATNNIVGVLLKDMQGNTVATITTQLTEGGLTKTAYTDDGYDIFSYPDIMPFNINLNEGRYYLQIKVSAGVFYSEVFTVVADISPYLKVEWEMNNDLIADGWRIQYTTGAYHFVNRLYLNTQLGKPEYVFEENGENRDGYFFAEKMVSEKTYKFNFLAPEYLCDVLRFVRMADGIRITDRYGRVYLADTFLITPKWQEQGDLASVDAEFTTDTVAKAIGSGILPSVRGDFNNDYNDDYDITNE